jgi:hypothetical protein
MRLLKRRMRLALLLKLLRRARLLKRRLRLAPLLKLLRRPLLGLLWFRHNGGTRPGNYGSAVRT